jgi:hypothetical protein
MAGGGGGIVLELAGSGGIVLAGVEFMVGLGKSWCEFSDSELHVSTGVGCVFGCGGEMFLKGIRGASGSESEFSHSECVCAYALDVAVILCEATFCTKVPLATSLPDKVADSLVGACVHAVEIKFDFLVRFSIWIFCMFSALMSRADKRAS